MARKGDTKLGEMTRRAMAKCLLDAGMNQREVARQVGMDPKNVYNVAHGITRVPQDMVDAMRGAEIAKWSVVVNQTLDHYIENADKILEKSNASQIVTAAAIAQDKRQVLLGEPTEIIEHKIRDMNIHDLMAEMQRVKAEVVKTGAQAGLYDHAEDAEWTDAARTIEIELEAEPEAIDSTRTGPGSA